MKLKMIVNYNNIKSVLPERSLYMLCMHVTNQSQFSGNNGHRVDWLSGDWLSLTFVVASCGACKKYLSDYTLKTLKIDRPKIVRDLTEYRITCVNHDKSY